MLFVVQFSIACACLAVSEEQQMDLASKGWKSASDSTRQKAQNLFKCCGFDLNDTYVNNSCQFVCNFNFKVN
jgi:tetraspanin-13/31